MSPEEIAGWRKRMGLSQAKAAVRLGVSPRHITYLEGGMRRPSETLIRLMRCLETAG